MYATTTTTELFFRQAVGRLVRWTPGLGDQPAYLYLPDDARLRAVSDQHGDDRAGDDQLSLFAAISATPVGDVQLSEEPVRPEPAREAIDVASAPRLPGHAGTDSRRDGHNPPVADPRAERRRLRTGNRGRAHAIAALSGWPHARVNSELNPLAGVGSVTSATIPDLRRRLRHADRWLSRL